jgi:hypothetical protein
MKEEIKQSVLDAIAAQFHLLAQGEYITHQKLIMNNAPIVNAFYLYDYGLGSHRTVAYLRRLCHEVTDDATYGCGHISAMKVRIKEGRKNPKRWVWGWPNDTQGKEITQEYDAKSAGIVKAQTGKAPQIGQGVVTTQTSEALEKAIGEKVEEKEKEAEAEEKEAAPIQAAYPQGYS